MILYSKPLIFGQVMGQNSSNNVNYSIFGHFLKPIGLKFFMVFQETIIYRLVMKNHNFDAVLKNSYVWRENGRGRQTGAEGYGASRLISR